MVSDVYGVRRSYFFPYAIHVCYALSVSPFCPGVYNACIASHLRLCHLGILVSTGIMQ